LIVYYYYGTIVGDLKSANCHIKLIKVTNRWLIRIFKVNTKWQKNTVRFIFRKNRNDYSIEYYRQASAKELFSRIDVDDNKITLPINLQSKCRLKKIKPFKMKIYSIYTDEMLPIKDIFLNSIKDEDWDVNVIYMGTAGEGGGDFATKGFKQLMKEKVRTIIKTIDDNMGDVIVWSDLDIQFFDKCSPLIEKAIDGKDIVFQAEHSPQKSEVNVGFSVIRCSQKTRALYEQIEKTDLTALPIAEQTAMNNLLRDNSIGVKWGLLPAEFWAMSHLMSCGTNPPANIVLHHANGTMPSTRNGVYKGSIELKLEQLAQGREYVAKLRKSR